MNNYQPKYTIKQILKENWVKFVLKNFFTNKRILFRKTVFENIIKIINCKESAFCKFACPNHPEQTTLVPLTCKSRSCPSCNALASHNWSAWVNGSFPNKPVAHITFTIPSDLRKFFLSNRKALKLIFKAAAETILSWFKQRYHCTPAITIVIHTFGAKMNWHIHLHMIVSLGGLHIDHNSWIDIPFIPQAMVQARFKFFLLDSLRSFFSSSFINCLFHKHWYQHIKSSIENTKLTIDYIGRYTKHPPMAQSRILHYANGFITVLFKDYYLKEKVIHTFPVFDFILLFIYHIPDKFAKHIMHYGLMANRVRSKYQLLLKKLGLLPWANHSEYMSWRARILKFSGKDPLACPLCGSNLLFVNFTYFNFFFPKSLIRFFKLAS
jgi:hypothetical protein